MKLILQSEQERDGRWLAEIPQLPGVMCYGHSKSDALLQAQVLGLRVLADQLAAQELQVQNVVLIVDSGDEEDPSASGL